MKYAQLKKALEYFYDHLSTEDIIIDPVYFPEYTNGKEQEKLYDIFSRKFVDTSCSQTNKKLELVGNNEFYTEYDFQGIPIDDTLILKKDLLKKDTFKNPFRSNEILDKKNMKSYTQYILFRNVFLIAAFAAIQDDTFGEFYENEKPNDATKTLLDLFGKIPENEHLEAQDIWVKIKNNEKTILSKTQINELKNWGVLENNINMENDEEVKLAVEMSQREYNKYGTKMNANNMSPPLSEIIEDLELDWLTSQKTQEDVLFQMVCLSAVFIISDTDPEGQNKKLVEKIGNLSKIVNDLNKSPVNPWDYVDIIYAVVKGDPIDNFPKTLCEKFEKMGFKKRLTLEMVTSGYELFKKLADSQKNEPIHVIEEKKIFNLEKQELSEEEQVELLIAISLQQEDEESKMIEKALELSLKQEKQPFSNNINNINNFEKNNNSLQNEVEDVHAEIKRKQELMLNQFQNYSKPKPRPDESAPKPKPKPIREMDEEPKPKPKPDQLPGKPMPNFLGGKPKAPNTWGRPKPDNWGKYFGKPKPKGN